MIPVRNIYYMLAYAFRVLGNPLYKKLETEEFDNIGDLCAALMELGVSSLVKRGISCAYIPITEELGGPKGKIELVESVRGGSLLRKKVVCSYDEFSIDSTLNRIVKTCMVLLIGADIRAERKKSLRSLLHFFEAVGTVDYRRINWNMGFHRHNQHYRPLISVCYLVVHGLLPSRRDGKTALLDVSGSREDFNLYERFVYEYFRKEFPQLTVASSHIDWQVDGEPDGFLPKMVTDISLSHGGKHLIIDAKYYASMLRSRFGTPKANSAHLYQIFAYVKNKEASLGDVPHEVSGMLLYAGTDEDVPDHDYSIIGNRIGVRSLKLREPFPVIRSQLDAIAYEYFGLSAASPRKSSAGGAIFA